MTSHEVKVNLLYYLLYERQYLAAATEYGGKGSDGIADVFGISKLGMTHEFEVKVSKADLVGELNAIRHQLATAGGTLFESQSNNIRKFTKHSFYLSGDGHLSSWRSRPNHFSFVVPKHLKEHALEGVKGTPYGVIVVDEKGNVVSAKSVGRLHKEPVATAVLYNLMHKLSVEVDMLRSARLREGKEPLDTSTDRSMIEGKSGKA